MFQNIKHIIIFLFAFVLNFCLNAQNNTPIATDLHYSTKINTQLELKLIGSDLDFGDELKYEVLSQPNNGTIQVNNNIVTYSPNGNFTGLDSFNFKVNDGTAESSTKSVYITVFKQYKKVFEPAHVLEGKTQNEQFGQSISVSEDHKTLAIGAYRNSDIETNSGQVKVFALENNSWNQKGQNINGTNKEDRLGISVSLSANGNRLAVGAYGNSEGAAHAGKVITYEFNGSNWEKIGNEIISSDELGYFGWRVKLSADGNILAASGYRIDNDNIENAGALRIYKWIDDKWQKISDDFFPSGSSVNDFNGVEISLSRNGKSFSSGALGRKTDGTDTGFVDTKIWNGSNYSQLNSGIVGPPNSQMYSNSMTSEGDVIAVGSTLYDNYKGIVRVYKRDNQNNWNQIGSDIKGENENDESGVVSLSSNGNLLAIGSPQSTKDPGKRNGKVKIYELSDNEWVNIGNIDASQGSNGMLGWQALLTSDGTKLIVSAPDASNSGNTGAGSGIVKIYNLIQLDNTKPIANDKTIDGVLNEETTIVMDGSDADGDELNFTILSLPSQGVLKFGDAEITESELPKTINSGSVIFSYNNDNPENDSFTFKVNDGIVDSDSAKITINVNQRPTANDQTVDAVEQTAKTITLTASDPDGDDITYIVTTLPSQGLLSDNGDDITADDLPKTLSSTDLVYTSSSDTATSDEFKFKVNDGSIDSQSATVTINIESVNDVPVANSAEIEVTEKIETDITLTGSDPDEDELSYIITALPTKGNLKEGETQITSDDLPKTLQSSTIKYTSTVDGTDTDEFSFKLNDGDLDSSIAKISISILIDNEAPVADDQDLNILPGENKTITLSGSDENNDPLKYIIVSLPSEGTLIENGSEIATDDLPKTISGTKVIYNNTNQSASGDSFKFKVNDGIVDSEDATISINFIKTVSFNYNSDQITENSENKIILTARIESSSNKNISIPFAVSGSAKQDEYSITQSPFTITAGSTTSQNIEISTKDIDDDEVEPIESIIINIGEIINGVSEQKEFVFNLLSDDKPTFSKVESEKDEFYENESIIVSASIESAHSFDVKVNFDFAGQATYNSDYRSNFDSKGRINTVAGGNSNGSELNQLNAPSSVHVHSNGDVYILDANNKRIVKWTKDSTVGESLITNLEIDELSGFFIDSNLNIYVAEHLSHRVTKWTPPYSGDGTVVAGGNGSGSGNNQLNEPFGVFVDESQNIYVSDGQNHRVMKWAPNASEGVLVAGGNGAGAALNQLHFPMELYVHSLGDIYITDESNGRIVKWGNGNSEGIVVAKNLAVPRGFHITEDKVIYIADRENDRVVKWKENYTEGVVISSGRENSTFNDPSDVFIDAKGDIYVADKDNARIEKILQFPELIIKAGELSGSIEISGIEEVPENNESDETIVIKPLSNDIEIEESYSKTITIKNNSLEFIRKDNPFIGLSKSSFSWGDFDRDGDLDVALMGQSNTVGAVTAIYKNDNGSFVDIESNLTKVYDGSLSWVDLNKDGWLDLVVSGYNDGAITKIYLNQNGESFIAETNSWDIPMAYNSKMSWGDLDNDGDLDLAFVGIDDSNRGFSYLYLRVNGENRFIVQDLSYFSGGGSKFGDIEIGDFDQDSDNDLIFTGERDWGQIRAQIRLNSFISPLDRDFVDLPLYFGRDKEENIPTPLKNASITTYFNQIDKELSYIMMGRDENDNLTSFTRTVGELDRSQSAPSMSLEDGDISVGDINNDGSNDFIFTGENITGNPVTKLFFGTPCGEENIQDCTFIESTFEFVELRESTVEFVDYDLDGDLDIFITGLSDNGAESILYETNLNNKVNQKPSIPENLQITDLGFGQVKLNWDPSIDDYSNLVGYGLRIGTTPGGSELTNTLSDLETGTRLVSTPPKILNNEFSTDLYPGTYYMAVQSIDPGAKSSNFSDEIELKLLYDWKILNQGGIVDKYIDGKKSPIVKLVDLDGDDDLDLLYGSQADFDNSLGFTQHEVIKFSKLTAHRYNSEEKRMIRVDREAKTEGSLSNFALGNITNIQVGLINDDQYLDVIINRYASANDNGFNIYLGKENTTNNIDKNVLVYNEFKIGNGLFEGKIKLSDLNNDGQLEIILAGLTSENTTSGLPKIYVYNFDESNNSFNEKDYSDQIASLTNSSFDLGDFDNDQDIDFVITGFDQSDGLKSFLYSNVSEVGGELKLEVSQDTFGATRDGSIDFFDFDTDGDLDILLTGTGTSGDIFKIYENNKKDGSSEWTELETLNIPGLRDSKIDYGDFNGDGYNDLLYSGVQSGSGKISELREYDPNQKNYVKSDFNIGEIIDADVEFGDIDGDGDLDFVLSGTNKNNENFHTINTFLNVRTESSIAESGIGLAQSNSVSNSNKRSSLVSASSTGNIYTKNNPPSPPQVKSIESLPFENVIDGKVAVEFSWLKSDDDLTISEGLSYAIRIGTQPGSSDILSTNSNESGFRSIPTKGNAEHNLKWKLALSPGTYYCAIQAIDASYVGSLFSEEVQFEVTFDDVNVENYSAVADNQTVDAVEQTAKTITLTASDPDGDDITYIVTTLPSQGLLSDNGDDITADDLPKTLSSTDLVYTSSSDTATSDEFKFKVNDGSIDSQSATVTINIESVNDVPVANSAEIEVTEKIETDITLTGSDPDEDELSYIITALPTKGNLKEGETQITSDDLPKTLQSSTIKYTSTVDGTDTDEFSFIATDKIIGGMTSSGAKIKLKIIPEIDSDGDGVSDSNDNCPNTPQGTRVDVNGCPVFELPLNNFKVEVGSATCVGKSDGVINLSVEDASYDYSVTITGQSDLSITGTSTTASFTGLAKGTYEVCFKVVGQDGYEQCFEVVVGEPKPLSAFIDVDDDSGKISISMSGSDSYNININGIDTTVDGDLFDTELSTGLSIIRISTDLECQGVIEREVFISEKIHYYPNPTISNVNVHVGGEDASVKVSVFSEKGDLIYTRDQSVEQGSRKIHIDLTNQITGTYIVTLESKTVRQSFKVIRE